MMFCLMSSHLSSWGISGRFKPSWHHGHREWPHSLRLVPFSFLHSRQQVNLTRQPSRLTLHTADLNVGDNFSALLTARYGEHDASLLYLRRAPLVGMLIVLARGEDGEQFVVLVRRPRFAAVDASFLELPAGQFGEDGEFVSDCSSLLESAFHMGIHKDSTTDLTALAFVHLCHALTLRRFGGFGVSSRGMFVSPEYSTESYRLHLFKLFAMRAGLLISSGRLLMAPPSVN
jgi:hypothetical protein